MTQSFKDFWQKLCQKFNHVPAEWEFVKNSENDETYTHSTSILCLAFSPDDSLLALAGGSCIPGADPSIRLIDVCSKKNIKTLYGHACGIYDLSFSRETGILASASFDYAVHLWNVVDEDVIFLRGADDRCKGFSKFTKHGSLLAIGECGYYDEPYSFYVYNLASQRNVFEIELPEEFGVTALALSSDSQYLAVTARDEYAKYPSRLYLVNLNTLEIIKEHSFEETEFFDLVFVGTPAKLLGSVSGGEFGECEPGLYLIEPDSGNVIWKEPLNKIGARLAVHPNQSEIAVATGGHIIRFYCSSSWKIINQHTHQSLQETENICSLAYSNSGSFLAYGLSSGEFDFIPRSS